MSLKDSFIRAFNDEIKKQIYGLEVPRKYIDELFEMYRENLEKLPVGGKFYFHFSNDDKNIQVYIDFEK